MNASNLRLTIPVVLGLGLVGFAATGGLAETVPAPQAVECGVVAVLENGMRSLQATVLSPEAISGSYQLKVMTSGPSGRSNISQGGAFSAEANDQVLLGQVRVNADASYKVEFELVANGVKFNCGEPIAS